MQMSFRGSDRPPWRPAYGTEAPWL